MKKMDYHQEGNEGKWEIQLDGDEDEEQTQNLDVKEKPKMTQAVRHNKNVKDKSQEKKVVLPMEDRGMCQVPCVYAFIWNIYFLVCSINIKVFVTIPELSTK